MLADPIEQETGMSVLLIAITLEKEPSHEDASTYNHSSGQKDLYTIKCLNTTKHFIYSSLTITHYGISYT